MQISHTYNAKLFSQLKLKFSLFILSLLFIVSNNSQAQVYSKDQIEKAYATGKTLPASKGRINDFENLLTADEESKLNVALKNIFDRDSLELVIVTLDSNYTNAESFEDYTYALSSYWKVGVATKRKGILIAVSKNLQHMRIQNGNQMDVVIKRPVINNIINNVFIPSFMKNEYYQGMVNGITALMMEVRSK